MALFGMGGVGKTQILQKYANVQSSSKAGPKPYDVVVYVNAQDASSVHSAILSFLQVHAPAELLQKNITQNDFGTFHTWLLSRDNWLLVFDNVQDYSDVQKAIPQGNRGHILFSTRHALIARRLSPSSAPIGVLPMEEAESVRLVQDLISNSSRSTDKELDVVRQVATFSRGIPLVIEQLVNNALLGGRSLSTTLQQVVAKVELLKQRNISSLHEDNLSLGAIVMQAFETIRARCVKAEALFNVLVYLEPSAIPLDMLLDGAKRYRGFLQQRHTYTESTATPSTQQDFSQRSRSRGELRVEDNSPKHNLSSLFKRTSKQKAIDGEACLPVDDIEMRTLLLQKCGPDTPLGRLFDNVDTIEDATITLCNAAIIRKTSDQTFWMHDLVSEVAKALIENRTTTPNYHAALTAATMVYLALPCPGGSVMSKRSDACRERLPHAIACHASLKDCGILNDSSIGPELSHLIASNIRGNMLSLVGENEALPSRQERAERERKQTVRTIEYFTHAYEGYMAGWRRMQISHEVSDEQVFRATRNEREDEIVANFDEYWFEGIRYGRFGRSAPWRAIQTAIAISAYSVLDSETVHVPETISKAIEFNKVALAFYEQAFGPNDLDTINQKHRLLYSIGTLRRDWRSAYELSIKYIGQFLEEHFSEFKGKIDPVDTAFYDWMSKSLTAAPFVSRAGSSLLDLAKASHEPETSVRLAEDAIPWLNLWLDFLKCRHGEDDFVNRVPMTRLADAYELAKDFKISIYWYGRAVLCWMSSAG